MRMLLPLLIATAIGASAASAAGDDKAAESYRKLIAGKVAEAPVDCIDTRFSQPSLTAYDDKLVYRVSSKLVYVSETRGGCQGVARGDTLVTRQFQPRLCRGDIARTVNFPAGIPTGSCAIGPFTPYRAR